MSNSFGKTPLEREPYSYRIISDDKAFIYFETRLLVMLRGNDVQKFVKKISKLEGLKAQKFMQKTVEELSGVV